MRKSNCRNPAYSLTAAALSGRRHSASRSSKSADVPAFTSRQLSAQPREKASKGWRNDALRQSRLLRKERPDIKKRHWKGVLCSPSYFTSSCGGAPISIVRQYIEQQQTTH